MRNVSVTITKEDVSEAKEVIGLVYQACPVARGCQRAGLRGAGMGGSLVTYYTERGDLKLVDAGPHLRKVAELFDRGMFSWLDTMLPVTVELEVEDE